MAEFSKFFLGYKNLQNLPEKLQKNGYQLIGPRIKNQAIVYDYINSFDDLPVGYNDTQERGRYRIEKTDGAVVFNNYTVGQNSIKQFIYPACKTILKIENSKKDFNFTGQTDEIPRLAIIGMRACELAALKILDKVLTQGPYVDQIYLKLRRNMFIIAVNCVNPGQTCFCQSMKSGPNVTDGFDLALTEINNKDEPYFIAWPGSDRGLKLIQSLSTTPVNDEQLSIEKKALEEASAKMGRSLSTDGIEDTLYREFDNPYWEEISEKCLACGNCTMVCPTCFCVDFKDETDLKGENAVRLRNWDSCFNREFSYIHGGSIRYSGKSRYRQWLMHKLSYWRDQFETSGCVGCGRCITWCPVGIDITEEASRVCHKT